MSQAKPGRASPTIAYLVSRFPKLTETFILYELLEVERHGIRVELFPLMRARASGVHPEGQPLWRKIIERLRPGRGTVLMHPEARPLVARAHYSGFMSLSIARDNLAVARRHPRRYFRTLGRLLVEMAGSPNYLLGSVAIFPLAVHFGQQMRALGVEHVHAHFANHPATAAWIIHRTTGLPYSFTGHGADLQVDQHMLARKVRESKATITISSYNRRFILEHAGDASADRVAIIHCGVDTAAVGPPSGVRTDAPPFEVLCIGTFYEVKGHRHLIEACGLLRQRGVAFTCRLVGEGPDRPKLEELVAVRGLEDAVRFEGTLTRAQVVEAMHRADMLVVPSVPTDSGRREGIPVVLMEAMATELPVIASGISGIPELVENERSGLLVPPADPQGIADAVQRLMDDRDLRRRIARAGRMTVMAEFDQATNARRLIERLGLA